MYAAGKPPNALEQIMAVWAIIVVIALGVIFIWHERPVKADPTPPEAKVVLILPEGTDEPRLIRVIDKQAGVVCYVIQNDAMDFYSGLQCIKLGVSKLPELN